MLMILPGSDKLYISDELLHVMMYSFNLYIIVLYGLGHLTRYLWDCACARRTIRFVYNESNDQLEIIASLKIYLLFIDMTP